MSTTAIPVCHTRQELHRQEDAVFNSIPGMDMLRSASPESLPELEVQYPDAAFALMIAGNLVVGDREPLWLSISGSIMASLHVHIHIFCLFN